MTKDDELFAKAFKDTTYKIAGLPRFELPIYHIHEEQYPTLDHSVDVFEYSMRVLIDRQKKIDERILETIRTIMREHNLTDYYAIDELRLLEIIDEAKAFEMIKNTFSLRQPLIEACNKKSKTFLDRKLFVKNMLVD